MSDNYFFIENDKERGNMTIVKTDSVMVTGGKPLKGTISIQGAKNAVLPILAGTILFKGEVVLTNVPDIADVRSFLDILEYLGATYTFQNGVVEIDTAGIEAKRISEDLSNRLRASSLLLGPLLARFGWCELGMPGGCSIGPRPLNYHFDGFEHIGSSIYVETGLIRASAKSIKGEYTLEFPSVGATENLIMASVFNDETVTLRNIAVEPEINDLVKFLQAGGADIQYDTETSAIEIRGVKEFLPIEHNIRPDRMEAGTFLFAAFATKGEITLKGVIPTDLAIVLEKLRKMGATIETTKDTITLKSNGIIEGTTIRTAVHPGFPTDLQPQMCALLLQANKPSMIVENVFDHRFSYIEELLKMNAKIETAGTVAYIEPSSLSGCKVEGHDLRATAALIIAALCTEGATQVTKMSHLYRGYDSFVEKLQVLGADICYF